MISRTTMRLLKSLLMCFLIIGGLTALVTLPPLYPAVGFGLVSTLVFLFFWWAVYGAMYPKWLP